MYLVECMSGKYFFQLTESMLDFVLSGDRYAHDDPTIHTLDGDKFRAIIKFTYRGSESPFHCEDKPSDCDVFTYDFFELPSGWEKSGWVDDQNNFARTRAAITKFAILLEATMIKGSNNV